MAHNRTLVTFWGNICSICTSELENSSRTNIMQIDYIALLNWKHFHPMYNFFSHTQLENMQKRKVLVSMMKINIMPNKKQVTDFVLSPSIRNKGQLELSWPTFLILIVFFYYFYPTAVFPFFSPSRCLFLSHFPHFFLRPLSTI